MPAAAPLPESGYFGTYTTLEHTSGDSVIRVDGNLTVIGSELDLTRETHVTRRGKEVPRIILSRGSAAMGFVPASLHRRLDAMLDAGWTCHAIASTSIFYKLEDRYITEVALICAAPGNAAATDAFASRIAAQIARGGHPDVNLSAKELSSMLAADGQWSPGHDSKRAEPMKGAAYYKTRQTATERLALAAAAGNKGCWVAAALAACLLAAAAAALATYLLS